MKRQWILFLAFLGLLPVLNVFAQQAINLKLLKDIPNVVFLQNDVIGGGAPSQKALGRAYGPGPKTLRRETS